MKEYRREYPRFALCGLNCGLCPRYHTRGSSRCPGCGGPEFHLLHPTCAIITCNKRHDNVQYCFQCSSYPCERYLAASTIDFFITYRNVLTDFERARAEGLEQYERELDERVAMLEFLIAECNDGRRKNYYCLATNLLSIESLRDVTGELKRMLADEQVGLRDVVRRAASLFDARAREQGVELKLRSKTRGS